MIIGIAMYFLFLVWHIDMSAWIASAGIVGIAVGFGAKDTLANLFAGIFIIADAPYKIGDYLVLETGERGRVTDIGLRSTRIITLDEVQIIVPNAVIGSSSVTNQSGGPSIKTRLMIPVGVSYESDVEEVRRNLLDLAAKAEHVMEHPPPVVRLMKMADSSLEFHLLAWIANPAQQDPTIDELNTAILQRFREVGIEIPYPKRDLYVRELPEKASSGLGESAEEK
jgi:small-conductance mechanosensitive channel